MRTCYALKMFARLIVSSFFALSVANAATAGDEAPAATIQKLHILIPGAAGGGWDRTARGTGEAFTKSGIIENVTFENMSGGGGGKAMAHLIEINRATTIMVNSTPIVVRALRGVFPQSFRDLTPIASVVGDYSVIAVRAESEFTNIEDLRKALIRDARAVPIAGGSVYGGTDHIVAAMLAQGLGADPATIKYIPYDAGGKAMVGLLSGEVVALASGYGEVVDLVEQGWVRLLCVASEERLQTKFARDVPTCIEAGADDLIFVNWRGFFAAKETDPQVVAQYRVALQRLLKTDAWSEVRDRYGWVDLFRPGQQFEELLAAQEASLRELLTQLGLL
jgi:putative tricarboxylic transport membrane protein